LRDAKVRNDIAVQVLPLISDLPNAAERDTFRQQLERMLGLREGTLLGTQAAGPRARRPRAAPRKEQVVEPPVVVPGRPTRRIESHCLGVLFRRPDLLYRLDRQLEQAGLSPLAPEDFEYTDHQMLFRLIRQSVEQDETDHHQFVTVHVPEALSGLARELITQTETLERVEDRLLDDLKGRLVDLRRSMASVRLNELSFQQEEDQTQGGSNTRFYQDQVTQIVELIKTLDQARKSFSHHK
jgi:DNA primase